MFTLHKNKEVDIPPPIIEPMLTLYFFLIEECEMVSAKWSFENYIPMMSAINSLEKNQLDSVWFYISGFWLCEKKFNNFFSNNLFPLLQKKANNIFLQCNIASVNLNLLHKQYKKINISYNVCLNPECGYENINNLINIYLISKKRFRSVSITERSDFLCVKKKICQMNCIRYQNLLFIMKNGDIKICPFGNALSNIYNDPSSLKNIYHRKSVEK